MSSHYDVRSINRIADRNYRARQLEQTMDSSKDVAKTGLYGEIKRK